MAGRALHLGMGGIQLEIGVAVMNERTSGPLFRCIVALLALRRSILPELSAVDIGVAVLAGRGRGYEPTNLRCRIDGVALGAGHGPVRTLQGIGLAVPREANVGGNEMAMAVAL